MHFILIFEINSRNIFIAMHLDELIKLNNNQLESEIRKQTKKINFLNVLVGFLVGILLYSVIKDGFRFFPVLILLVIISLLVKSSNTIKDTISIIKLELSQRADRSTSDTH